MKRSTHTPKATGGWDCTVCGQHLAQDAGWHFRSANDIVHCEGSVVAEDATKQKPIPHHGHRLHPNCWRCQSVTGCDQCAGIHALCRRCLVWVTPEGLAHNGPLTNGTGQRDKRGGRRAPQVEEYPPQFQAAWRQQLAADPPEFAALYAEYRAELARDPHGAEKRMGERLRGLVRGIGRPMPAVDPLEF